MKLNKVQNVSSGERNAQTVREKCQSRQETADKNLHVRSLVLSQPAGAVTIIKLFLNVLTGTQYLETRGKLLYASFVEPLPKDCVII